MKLGKKRATIALFFNYLYEDYEHQIWANIVKSTQEHDVNFISFGGGAINSPDHYHAQRNTLFELVNKKNVDGIISISASLGNYISSLELNNFLKKFNDIPLVSIGVEFKSIPSILIDNTTGMKNLMTHLIEHHGYKRIAFIRGSENNPEAEERFNIYKDMLNKHNLKLDDRLIAPGDFDRYAGRDAVILLLDKRKVDFDVIVSSNDSMALYAMKELQERSYRIPDDIAIVGFDDIKENLSFIPSLTTVRQPFYEMGELAVKTVMSMINGEKVFNKIVLPTKLIVRRSCGCLSPITLEKKTGILNNIKVEEHQIIKEFFDVLDNDFQEIKRNIKDNEWIKNIIILIIEGIKDKEKVKALDYLENIITGSFNVDHGRYLWHEVISRLFDILFYYYNNTGDVKYLSNLWKDASIIVSKIGEHFQANLKEKKAEQSVVLFKISQELITTFNVKKLNELIVHELPKLGIKSCYLSLYKNKNNRKKARLLLSYNLYKNNAIESKEFDSSELIPGYFNNIDRYSYIIMPLYFKTDQLGFVIFEIGPLDGAIYETLSTQLGSAIKGAKLSNQLKKYTNNLEKKVAQRTKELLKANKQKTRFFINLAHETKTPLTLIKNYLEKYISDKGIDSDLRIIKYNIDKLLKDMINFLDSEKLLKGKLFYNNDQIINISEILENKILIFKEVAFKKNININFEIQKKIFIKIDPYGFDRIINNLLDNSLKYTDENGIIDIKLKSINNKIVLNIKDTGIGISENYLKNIFDPYFQLSHKKRGNQGIGVGLSIVKQILDKIGAQIEIKSKVNKGSEFILYFNKCNIPFDNEELKDNNFNFNIDSDVILIDLKEGKYDSSKNNIFIIDDNIEMLSFLQLSLWDKYNVYFAKNGREALDKIKSIPTPEIIISDIMMDELDGYQLITKIKNIYEYNDIPFIFLTAKSTSEDKIKGLLRGAVDYIYKPFLIEELIAKIDSIISDKKIQKEKNINLIKNKVFNALKINNIKNNTAGDFLDYDKIYKKYGITKREKEIITFLLQGLFNKEISNELNISIRTVEFHIHNIYKKFNVENKIELIKFFKSIKE